MAIARDAQLERARFHSARRCSKKRRAKLADRVASGHSSAARIEIRRAGLGAVVGEGGVIYAHAPSWALSRVVALRVHLDASTCENGPLRVVPGSHLNGVCSDADVLDVANSRDEVECPAPRGGVLAMRPLLIHSSSKCLSDEPRRVLHIEYADSLDLAPGINLAVV